MEEGKDMTWGEFKKLAELAGVTDEMEIDFIDIRWPAYDKEYKNFDFKLPNERQGGLVIA